jgi:hypothetical protein
MAPDRHHATRRARIGSRSDYSEPNPERGETANEILPIDADASGEFAH